MAVTDAYTQIKDDYLYLDNVETVTFTPVNATAVTTAKALFEPGSEGELGSMSMASGFAPDQEVAFIVLFNSTLSSNRVDPGSKVYFAAGDATTWTVVSARQKTFRTRWRCFCVRDRA